MLILRAWSEELQGLLEQLTPKQRAAIPRIVAHRAEGGPLTSLLRGVGKVCAWRTYYKKPRGWSHNEVFNQALEMAQREYGAYMLGRAVDQAVDDLRRGTQISAAFLLDEVRAGRRMQFDVERSELPLLERGLLLIVENGEASAAIRAAGQLARIWGSQKQRAMRAGLGILDRADIKTAMKATVDEGEKWARLLRDLRGMDEDVAELETETGNLQGIGV